MKTVILLATYNGGSYLKELLDSIISQTYQRWVLRVRDDCSTDDSTRLIADYSLRDSRIEVVTDGRGRLGPAGNFAELLRLSSDADYVLFCDQDDIWRSTKVERQLKAILAIEGSVAPGTTESLVVPALCYGTYEYIDASGASLANPSPRFLPAPTLRTLISENYIYGCTVIINRALASKVVPVDSSSENHDYWIALTATALEAKLAYIPEPLLYYRQHDSNVSGTLEARTFTRRLARLITGAQASELLRNRARMASAVLARFDGALSNRNRSTLSAFIRACRLGGLRGVFALLPHGIRRRSVVHTLALYLAILRGGSV